MSQNTSICPYVVPFWQSILLWLANQESVPVSKIISLQLALF